jgi:hypothetical protein
VFYRQSLVANQFIIQGYKHVQASMAAFNMTPPVPDSTPRVSASPNPPTGPPICHQEPTAANPSFLDNLYDEDKYREFSSFEVCFPLIFSFVMWLVVFHYRFEPVYYFLDLIEVYLILFHYHLNAHVFLQIVMFGL